MGRTVIPLPHGARLVVDVNAHRVVSRLRDYAEGAGKTRPLLTKIATLMRQGFKERFAEGGDPQWKALATSTILAKLGLGVPTTGKNNKTLPRLRQFMDGGNGNAISTSVLIATGALRDSYSIKGAKGHTERLDEKAGTVSVGSTLPYAAIHQQGVDIPYPIQAQAGKTLRFTGSGGAVYRNRVIHPGIAARPVSLSRRDLERIQAEVEKHYEFKEA